MRFKQNQRRLARLSRGCCSDLAIQRQQHGGRLCLWMRMWHAACFLECLWFLVIPGVMCYSNRIVIVKCTVTTFCKCKFDHLTSLCSLSCAGVQRRVSRLSAMHNTAWKRKQNPTHENTRPDPDPFLDFPRLDSSSRSSGREILKILPPSLLDGRLPLPVPPPDPTDDTLLLRLLGRDDEGRLLMVE